jgi:DNA-binding response OmpR family regulator
MTRIQNRKRQPTVLFVDDESAWLNAVKMVLGKDSYKVVVAGSGDEALTKIRRKIPDLIVSDLRMPTMSGFDLFEKVKENPSLRSVPFVFMSSIDDYDARKVAEELGADDYFEKPYDATDMKSMMKDLLERFGKR